MLKSVASSIGQINFWKKLTRKRSAGNPHAAFDVAGAGNVLKIQWRASSRPYYKISNLFSEYNIDLSAVIELTVHFVICQLI